MRGRLYRCLLALTVLLAAGLLLDSGGSFTAVATAAVLALVVLACVHSAGAADQLRIIRAARYEHARADGPARQCDPDAAGHIRARAPGLFA